MGLLQEEIKELRQLLADVKANKVTSDKVDQQLRIYAQIEKRAGQIIQVVGLAAKYARKGDSVYRKLVATNLIGDGEAIALNPNHEEEMIRCRVQNDCLISRASCLDYSGIAEHTFECHGCTAGLQTKELCLGPKGNEYPIGGGNHVAP